MRMTLRDFVDTYCVSIKKSVQREKSSTTRRYMGVLSYDAMIIDSEGHERPVIFDDYGTEILVDDIWQCSFEDFQEKYMFDSAVDAYTNYRKAYSIKEGLELAKSTLDAVEEQKRRYRSSAKSKLSVVDV